MENFSEILTNAKDVVAKKDLDYNISKALTLFVLGIEKRAKKDNKRFEIISCYVKLVRNKYLKNKEEPLLTAGSSNGAYVSFIFDKYLYYIEMINEDFYYTKEEVFDDSYTACFRQKLGVPLYRDIYRNNAKAVNTILQALIVLFPKMEEKKSTLNYKFEIKKFIKF